jgi:hypothetical protein
VPSATIVSGTNGALGHRVSNTRRIDVPRPASRFVGQRLVFLLRRFNGDLG